MHELSTKNTFKETYVIWYAHLFYKYIVQKITANIQIWINCLILQKIKALTQRNRKEIFVIMTIRAETSIINKRHEVRGKWLRMRIYTKHRRISVLKWLKRLSFNISNINLTSLACNAISIKTIGMINIFYCFKH